MNFELLKLSAGALATVGFYSVLYRENKFYRLCEHIYIGLAVGYSLVAIWTETLHDSWWTQMVGTGTTNGHWLWIALLPIGMLGYFVFSEKNNWLSRIPPGILLGLWSGQQVQTWFTQYGGQISNSLRPVLPSTTSWFHPSFAEVGQMSPEQQKVVANTVYGSQAVTNLLFMITLLSVMSYFLFSFDVKNKAILKFSTMGRWLLMIGFGAIFGSTVMMRFSLVIDRMYFIFVEFLKQGILHMK